MVKRDSSHALVHFQEALEGYMKKRLLRDSRSRSKKITKDCLKTPTQIKEWSANCWVLYNKLMIAVQDGACTNREAMTACKNGRMAEHLIILDKKAFELRETRKLRSITFFH